MAITMNSEHRIPGTQYLIRQSPATFAPSPRPRHRPLPQPAAVHPEQRLAHEQCGGDEGELEEEAAFALAVEAGGVGEFERLFVGVAVA
jgi:hypothetical protein